MSFGNGRVLRERRPSRPVPEDYLSVPHHNLPQAYDAGFYQNHGYPTSEHSTRYTSPASSDWLPEDVGGSGNMNEYGYALSQPHYVGNTEIRSYGRGTPPTPAGSDISIADPRFAGTAHWTRSATPRSKPKRPKKEKTETPKSIMPGDKPVPILSHDCTEPIQKIEDFVNRSAEVRLKEVEGKNGYTPRPMNNFMLYRKAYQEKAKQVSTQTNHQVVSVVVAASWKNEAKEIKEMFARYAQTEKQNHIQAFPNYQFRPNKAGAKAKKRKADDFEDESELEEPDWRGTPVPKRQKPANQRPVPVEYATEPQYIQAGYPYPQTSYAVDFNGRPIYYEQTGGHHWDFQTQATHEELDWQTNVEYQGLDQPFSPTALSGLPGGGNALLDPDFSNSVFDDPTILQSNPLLVSNDVGSGAFTQVQFESLGSVANDHGWTGNLSSLDGRVLTTAYQRSPKDLDENQLLDSNV